MIVNENKLENTPTGGALVGKRKGQTMIHNKGSMSGYLVGKTHAEGGIKAINKSTGQPLEMQGGEVVITAPAVSDQTKRNFDGKMMTNREILSAINERGGGVSFAESGMEIPTEMHFNGTNYNYGGKMLSDHDIAYELSQCGCEHEYNTGGNVPKVPLKILNKVKKLSNRILEIEKMNLGNDVYSYDGNLSFKERAKLIAEQDKLQNELTEVTDELTKDQCYSIDSESFRALNTAGDYGYAQDEYKGGGHLAEGFSLRDIAEIHQVPLAELKKQVRLGMKAESEHTASKREQMKIVKDHLFENPKYYSLLKKAGLEDGGKFNPKPFLDFYFEEIKDFLKDQNDIILDSDFTFKDRGELFTIEPLIQADNDLEGKIKTANFIIIDQENDIVGEITFNADNSKPFHAYSDYFQWNNIKFEGGGETTKVVTYKDKYNRKYNYPKNTSHTLEEISKDTNVSMKGLQQIYNKGIGAYKTNPASVRPNVKSKEQWAMARVYSAVMGGKASKVDSNELKMNLGGNIESLYENENDYIKYLVAFNLADGVESYKLNEYLKSKGLNNLGLLPDDVKKDPEYIKIKRDFDIAFKRLQNLPKFKYQKNRDRVQEQKDRKKANEISNKIIQIKLKNESFENGGANEIGGTYNIKNQFDSFTTIKIMPIDENLKVSKEFFSVKITVRAKSGDVIQIQEKPLVTYPISKYQSFINDLNKRNPTKFKKGGEVENLSKDAKIGNTPARDLNNYNDVLDVGADGEVGGYTGLYAGGGEIGSDFTFLKSNPMQRARAITVLEKKIRHDGKIISNYEFLEQLPKDLEVGVSKLHSRKTERGYVEKSTIGDFIVDSKAEIDYYQYLQNSGYPYSKYIKEVTEAEAKKNEAEKIIRDKENEIKKLKNIENYKKSEISKKNQIKELIEKGADAMIKKMNAPRLVEIEKYKNQRQTNDVKQEIDFQTRMIEQTERQIKDAYKIAFNLYEIVNGEVQPKFQWKIGDKVKIEGYLNHEPAEIETEIVEIRVDDEFGFTNYKVEKKEGIANNYISYDGLYPLLQNNEKQNKKEYEYVLTQRPFSIGTYPPQDFVRFEDRDFNYGVLVYSQPIPLKDVEHYSLSPITIIKEYDGKILDYKLGNLKLKARVKLETDNRKGYLVNIFISDDNGVVRTQRMSGVNFLLEMQNGKLSLENESSVEPMNDIEITTGYFKVDSENTGFEYAKKINNYFNKWNNIKTLQDKLDFETLEVPMFGSFENENILDQIEHFEKIGFEVFANEIVRNDFKKEVKKIIDKKIFDREMDKRRYPKEDEEVAKKQKSFESEGSTEGKGKLYEFFTPQVVADKMLALAQHYGFKGGNVLEPATGSGRLIKNLKNTNITAFEISKDNFEILQREFPNAELYNFNFEKAFLKEPRFNTLLNRKGTETWLKGAPFDLVLANSPYGKFSGLYSSYFNFKGQVEHFFILQTLYLLKKGGLGVYLIPSSFLRNGSAYNEIKKQIFEIAEFVDAYRLPSNIFEKTQIGTDILILRKK